VDVPPALLLLCYGVSLTHRQIRWCIKRFDSFLWAIISKICA